MAAMPVTIQPIGDDMNAAFKNSIAVAVPIMAALSAVNQSTFICDHITAAFEMTVYISQAAAVTPITMAISSSRVLFLSIQW